MRVFPPKIPILGTYRRVCARCGFEYLRSELVKETWSNLIVCPDCLYPEPEHLKKRKIIKEKPFKRD